MTFVEVHSSDDAWARIRGIFGDPPPPAEVTEEQFDGYQTELEGLARTPCRAIDFAKLYPYYMDLAYVPLQSDLFRYLFPACLMHWFESLVGNASCSVGEAGFHKAVLSGRVLERMLLPGEREQVLAFLCDAFLSRLSRERGLAHAGPYTSAHAWIRRLNSLGYIVPDMRPIWSQWWALSGAGYGVALVEYCSCLMYRDDENPIFAPWTPEEGGGPPCLWETDDLFTTEAWPAANASLLESALAIESVHAHLLTAVSALRGLCEAPVAERVGGDWMRCRERVMKRARALPRILSGAASEEERRQWSR